ncbi:hypothetical protein GALL_146520 [mine drainage metagenome]|uniref:DUF218 domain-containing protein n=1 Tax=mine drainage metagenome TaxID=410659 RepID=A0A1J5SG51_9ZZZZ
MGIPVAYQKMIRIALCRKRQIWLPTIFGWLLLLTFIFVLCVFGVRNIYTFLAPNDPVGARVLVVEGWLSPKELDQAIQIFKMGGYTQVVTTGGPTEWPEEKYGNYAVMSADYVARRGIRRDMILVVPAPPSAQERTFLSAVTLRESAQRLGIKLDAIDLVSSGAHARRSRLLFQMALGSNVNVGVLATKPADFGPETWWQTSKGVESIIFQSIGLLWVKCFFWPSPPGSRQERWGL